MLHHANKSERTGFSLHFSTDPRPAAFVDAGFGECAEVDLEATLASVQDVLPQHQYDYKPHPFAVTLI